MSKVLLVAYHFPPVGGLGAAGSQRMHKFAKHLPAFGWEPIVLTLREDEYEDYLKIDSSLMEQVSRDLQIERTGKFRLLTPLLTLKNTVLRRRNRSESPSDGDAAVAAGVAPRQSKSAYQKFKDAVTDLFEIPDETAGWIIPATRRGRRVIKQADVDLILATGRPWTTLIIGGLLKMLTGRPLILDFRDPWMTNPFRIEYSGIKNAAERRLERWVVKSADLVIGNTEELRQEFVERFGQDDPDKFISVLNGFDAEEFASVKPEPRRDALRDSFLLLHSGFLYGRRDPRPVIEAIRRLRDEGHLDRVHFHCELVGNVHLDYDLAELIRELDLDDIVSLRGEVSYVESLAAVAACDVALLLQPGTTTQVPSKLFEYIGLGKRMLTIAPAESSVAAIVKGNALGSFSEPEDVPGIAAAIGEEIDAWQARTGESGIADEDRDRFDVRNCVQLLADNMNKIRKT